MRNGTAGNLIQRFPRKLYKAQFISHRGALPLLQGSEHGNGAVRPSAGRHGSMSRIRNGRTGHIRWGGRSARQLKNQFHGAHGTAQDIPGGSAAFKAVGRVGGQGQPAGRGADGGGLEPGGLQNDIRSGVRHAAFLPPITPPMASALPDWSATTRSVQLSVYSCPSRALMVSPS